MDCATELPVSKRQFTKYSSHYLKHKLAMSRVYRHASYWELYRNDSYICCYYL